MTSRLFTLLIPFLLLSLIQLTGPQSTQALTQQQQQGFDPSFQTQATLEPSKRRLPQLSNMISPTHKLSPTTSIDQPTYIKGLYITYHAMGHEGLRSHALDLIDQTELNTIVIDIKGDLGLLTYKSEVITATDIGANNAPTLTDWQSFMQDMEDRNIYTIARIVVFKDDYMGRAHPEWAVKTATGDLWFDGENLPWLEAFYEEVWDYNIALAVEAAQRGFDEIQFDYIRFPTDGSLSNIVYSRPVDEPEIRTAAINGFLAKAQRALSPYDVKLAVDVFGYTTWHLGDFGIGQDLADMAAYVDIISPMTYPSTYSHGLPGLPEYSDNPVAHPYAVVYESVMRGMARVKASNPDLIIRPWIQDFPDYAYDRRTYSPTEIREQMFGVYDSGGGGWMLWDPRVRYTPAALTTDDGLYSANEQGEILVLRYQNFGDLEQALQRSAESFRQDLETLWAAGCYPINLSDLVAGNLKYQQDLEQLRLDGWLPFHSEELLQNRLNYIPAGKCPVVLTFDGSHLSQYQLLADGSLDPNSAMGVLQSFHAEHPADWPLRATFFVTPEADDPNYLLFGQPEFAAQKLQNLVDWGMEVGSYTLTGVDLSASSYEEVRRQLSSETTIEGMIPGYEVVSLALPGGQQSQFKSLLRRGIYGNLLYDYSLIALTGNQPNPSPRSPDFNPYHIQRIDATSETVIQWLAFYQNNPGTYYVSAGIVPDTKPGEQSN